MPTKHYVLDISKLEVGDILLTSVGGIPSVGIRKLIKSDYSHAMLYVGGGSYIHSDLTGVHADNLQHLLLDSPSRATVLRVERLNRSSIVSEVVTYARRKVGTQYSKREAAGVIVKKLRSDLTNRQFCSRLVALAFAEAAFPLVADANYCTPQDIFESSVLIEVPGCVRAASPSEVEFANSFNPLEVQRRGTNQFLEDVRKISGLDIQMHEQVAQCVVDHPEYDDAISEALQRSGYLDFWRLDVSINPWRYSSESFLNLDIPTDRVVDSARYEVSSAKEAVKRFSFCHLQYRELNERFPRRYFQLEHELYKLLVELHTERMESAQLVILRLEGKGL